MADEQQCCGNCRFWLPDEDPDNDFPSGECRRFPPELDLAWISKEKKEDRSSLEGFAWCAPFTFDDYWCGEFQKRPRRRGSSKSAEG